jgi:hypothetical protein
MQYFCKYIKIEGDLVSDEFIVDCEYFGYLQYFYNRVY